VENTDSKRAILEAAVRVAQREGFSGLTIDAVAREAGISKGGLFHYFPTKQHLLQAVVEHFGLEAAAVLKNRIERIPADEKARMIRAMFSVAFPEFHGSSPETDPEHQYMRSHRDFMLGMMVASRDNRDLVLRLRGQTRMLMQSLLSDPETANKELLLWLAMDGLWMWRLMGIVEDADDLYQTIGRMLVEEAQGLSGGQ